MPQTPITEFHTVDYAGRKYLAPHFHARKDPGYGPGWYVFGRNTKHYGGNLVMRCAQPAVQPRKHPRYNCKVRRGWHTKREADKVAAEMNTWPSLQPRDTV